MSLKKKGYYRIINRKTYDPFKGLTKKGKGLKSEKVRN